MPDFSLESGAVEMLLIRHADAHPSEHASPTTHADLPLSEKGREQAALLGARYASQRIDAIVASPLQRTKQTAEALVAAHGLTIVYDDRLREVHIGDGSVAYDLASLAKIAVEYGGWSHLPGAEPSASIRERMRSAIEEFAQTYAGSRIAVVSHAGTINACIADFLGLKRDFFFPAGNTSVSTIRAHEGLRMIVTLNDTAHLQMAMPHGA